MEKESKNAEAVAKEVIEKVRKGKKVYVGEIMENHGYSKSTAKTCKVKKTKSYQKVIKPFVDLLIEERDRAVNELGNKNLDDVSYKDLTAVIDTLTKNIQLLSGGNTERIGIEGLTAEINNLINDLKNDGKTEKVMPNTP
jgi:hypothetical protein